MRLSLRPSVLLLIIRWRLRHYGGDVIVGVADRGVDDDCSVRGRDKVFSSVVVGSLGPLNFLHVGRPDVSPSFAGRDSDHDECGYISKYYQGSNQRTDTIEVSANVRIRALTKESTTITWIGTQTTTDHYN